MFTRSPAALHFCACVHTRTLGTPDAHPKGNVYQTFKGKQPTQMSKPFLTNHQHTVQRSSFSVDQIHQAVQSSSQKSSVMVAVQCREDALEGVQQGAANLLKKHAALPAGLLEATRMKDANIQEPSRATVRSVEFHPSGQLLFTSGLDKSLRFFQVLP